MREHGSLINQYAGNDVAPEVGIGATMMGWTDRYAGTVVSVDGDKVTVQDDKATRVDSNGMSDAQSYTYERDLNGALTVFRLVKRGRRKGQYVEAGADGGMRVVFGVRNKYHDYSF